MSELNEVVLLEAFRARLARVLKDNGFFTDAGAKVIVQRADPTPESDGDELLGVTFLNTEYESRGSADRDVRAKSEFQLMGYTGTDPESQAQSVYLLRDILRAAFEPASPDDVLQTSIDVMLPVQSGIYLARKGMDYTFAELILIVTWCDHSVEQYLT